MSERSLNNTLQAVSDGVEGEAVCDLGAVLEMGSDELGVLVEELEAVPSDVDIDLDVSGAGCVFHLRFAACGMMYLRD